MSSFDVELRIHTTEDLTAKEVMNRLQLCNEIKGGDDPLSIAEIEVVSVDPVE